jgi:formylglycine-generating enzyme required for sulfatase activity
MRLLAAFANKKPAGEERPIPAVASVAPKVLQPIHPVCSSAPSQEEPKQSPEKESQRNTHLVLQIPGGPNLEFRWCPPGSFLMGSPLNERGRGMDEGPVEVRIQNGFWMGCTQVTQEIWKAVMGSSPSHFLGARRPVENVTWEDATRFLTAASRYLRVPAGYRLALPTEAQWEYACRAGTATPFHFGEALSSEQANYNGNYPYGYSEPGSFLEETVDCGSYPPNAWGLFDMHGNVWEWCADWYGETLAGGDDPRGPDMGPGRVYRGGSWHSIAEHCRSGFRYYLPLGSLHMFLGFRVALVGDR